jgi:hypothetical protein
VAYARDSLAPFTITSIVLAGLFLISVLPVMIPAIWAGEGPRRAAQAVLYLMLGASQYRMERSPRDMPRRPDGPWRTSAMPALRSRRRANSPQSCDLPSRSSPDAPRAVLVAGRRP